MTISDGAPTDSARSDRARIAHRVHDIPSSGIRKFFDLIASRDDIISLGVGEPDFVTPWHIREAAIDSLKNGDTHYTSNFGVLELRKELSLYLERLYGAQFAPESQLLITVGVSEALDLALRATLNPGDEVITADPSYVAYFPVVHMAGGTLTTVPTTMEDEFRLRASEVERRITPQTRTLLINHPSNPTGAVLERATVMQLADIAERHDLLIIADEIYDRLVYSADEPFTSFASVESVRDRTIVLGGFSKAFAMTGWRVGYAAGPSDIIAAMMKVHQYTMMSAPTMAQAAALEALRDGERDVAEMREAYDQRRRALLEGFHRIGLPCVEPQGAFYAFPSIMPTGMTSEEFAERLLIEEGVAVVPGSAFGQSGEGFVRCCYAASLEDIDEAIVRMGRFVARHARSG